MAVHSCPALVRNIKQHPCWLPHLHKFPLVQSVILVPAASLLLAVCASSWPLPSGPLQPQTRGEPPLGFSGPFPSAFMVALSDCVCPWGPSTGHSPSSLPTLLGLYNRQGNSGSPSSLRTGHRVSEATPWAHARALSPCAPQSPSQEVLFA